MSDRLDNTVIEGAGGIVERYTLDGIRIAVVSRKRYGREWSLPKGKREPGESWQETALREVEEEIGLRAVIIGIAGSSIYLAEGLPKLVVYWRMRVDSDVPAFAPNDEVAALEWLLPQAAVERLTYAEQKEVVRKAFPQFSPRRQYIADVVEWLGRQWVLIVRRRSLKRLATEIKAYKEELQGRAKCARSIDTVKAAESAAADGDIDCGWEYLQTAHRLELAASQDPAINAAAITIRRESDHKLDGWRKTAVNELLTVANGATFDVEKVCEAARIRDEHYNNEAYKDGLRRSNALRLAIFLFLAILALLGIACNSYLIAAIQPSPDSELFKVLVSLVVVGWLGATISAITNPPKPDLPSRIPELVSTFRVTVLRLLMGPALAIIAYFLMRTELSQAVFAIRDKSGYIILIIAFAAGFSERLVLRVIEAIERKPNA